MIEFHLKKLYKILNGYVQSWIRWCMRSDMLWIECCSVGLYSVKLEVRLQHYTVVQFTAYLNVCTFESVQNFHTLHWRFYVCNLIVYKASKFTWDNCQHFRDNFRYQARLICVVEIENDFKAGRVKSNNKMVVATQIACHAFVCCESQR